MKITLKLSNIQHSNNFCSERQTMDADIYLFVFSSVINRKQFGHVIAKLGSCLIAANFFFDKKSNRWDSFLRVRLPPKINI